MSDPMGEVSGRGRAVRDTRTAPEQPGRDIHAMTDHDLIVYEAIATLRRPMSLGDVAATTGLDPDTVRASLGRLIKRNMIVEGRKGVEIGPNDWDVWGAT